MSQVDVLVSPKPSFIPLWDCPFLENSNDWGTTLKVAALELASFLTEPVCKVREYFYSFYILDKTTETAAQKVMQIAALSFGILGYAVLIPLTTPIGIFLRGAVSVLEAKPFIYITRAQKGKTLQKDQRLTLLSYNICLMPGGYSITDGGVIPPSDRRRVDACIEKIKRLDPDVVCLYEVPDILDASYLAKKLADYPFIIPVAGVRAVGPNSMMFVLSKYKIDEESIEFIPFEKGTELTGRAQYSEKGFLSFDLQDREKIFASIVSAHLQHSEVPSQPKDWEKISRAKQMEKIIRYLEEKVKSQSSVIFTGDLNQDEEELNIFFQSRRINWLRSDPEIQGVATWGGDEWCAKLTGKPISQASKLDHILVSQNIRSIATEIFQSGFHGQRFEEDATSDHDLLFSTIDIDSAMG